MLHRDESRLLLHVERRGAQIKVAYRDDGDTDNAPWECSTKIVQNLPDFGYFTIIGVTSARNMDDHDVFRVETKPLSQKVKLKHNYSKINRKILEEAMLKRRRGKLARRGQMDRSFGPNSTEFADSLKIVNELIWRQKLSVSKSSLNMFVNRTVAMKIDTARSLVDSAQRSFQNMRTDISGLWKTWKGEFVSLNETMKREFRRVVEEMVRKSDALVKKPVKPQAFKEAWKSAQKEKDDIGPVAWFLLVAQIEFTLFIIFCIVRARKTHGFKKHD
jgi:hypothetical protein